MRVRMAERNEYVKRRLGAEAFDNTRSKGLLFVKHPGSDGATSELIVVAEIDDPQLRQRVDRLLRDHEVRLVEANEQLSFAAEIEREAH